MSEVDELRAQLSAMETRLREVEARLEAEAAQRRGLMRDSRRCPACGGTKIYHVERITGGLDSGVPLSAQSTWYGKSLGAVQAFACAACGHCEMSLKDPAALEGKKHVQILIAPERHEGPYR